MKFCKQINKKNAVATAMRLLSQAKKSVCMTMDMKSEIEAPLPKEYHLLLAQLSKKNIEINRYAYGKKSMFIKMKNTYMGVQMHYGGPMNKYQRMLVIDKKMGMFGVDGVIFFTKFTPLVESLLKYIDADWR